MAAVQPQDKGGAAVMTIQRYRRKAVPSREEDVIAVRYEPGAPRGELAEVARRYDDDAELTEAVLPSGPVLLGPLRQHRGRAVVPRLDGH